MRNPLVRKSEVFDPFWSVNALQRQVDSLFDDFLRPLNREVDFGFNAACDLSETDGHYLVSLDLPGMSKNDIHIELRDNQLRVSGERKREKSENEGSRHFMERAYGRFERVFTLPASVETEKVEANFENGVLRIAVPKAESAKPKRIEIKEGVSGVFQKLLGKKEASVKAA